MTNATWLHQAANEKNIPVRTLSQVQESLQAAKKTNSDAAMARLMCRHGRLTDEALLWIGDNYPTVWA